jgi:hypothetical protein
LIFFIIFNYFLFIRVVKLAQDCGGPLVALAKQPTAPVASPVASLVAEAMWVGLQALFWLRAKVTGNLSALWIRLVKDSVARRQVDGYLLLPQSSGIYS